MHFDGRAGGINHWADFDDPHRTFFIRQFGVVKRKLRSPFDPAYKSFGKSEAHEQRRLRGYPEQTVAFGDILPGADVTAGDDSIKGSGNVGLFQFQFK